MRKSIIGISLFVWGILFLVGCDWFAESTTPTTTVTTTLSGSESTPTTTSTTGDSTSATSTTSIPLSTSQVTTTTTTDTTTPTSGTTTTTTGITTTTSGIPTTTSTTTMRYFTIFFESNGGSAVSSISNVPQGTLASAPANPTKEDYVFSGWYSDEELTIPWDFSHHVVTYTLTLYAKWNPPSHTLSFEVDGGSIISPQYVFHGSLLVPPTPPTKELYDFVGWFADEEGTIPWVFESDVITGDMTLYAKWIHQGTAISTAAELEAFILNGEGTSLSGIWYLSNDIDMSGITTLVGSRLVFAGTFDGQGYVIRNIEYTAADVMIGEVTDFGRKTGFLFKELASGSLVTNLRFEDCIVTGIGEANAFLTAFAQAGATISNLEMINCSLLSPGSYAALLIGDVVNNPADGTSTQITIRNITVINDADHRVEGLSYVGGLIGSCRKGIVIDLENIYFDSLVTCPSTVSGQACGAIMGRHNGTPITLNVRNAVIKGAVSASQKNGGVILGTSVSGSIINVDRLFLDDLVLLSGTNKIGTIVGNPVSVTTVTATNVFYNSETVVFHYGTALPYTAVNPDNATALSTAEVTEPWFDASGFPSFFFKYGANSLIRNYADAGEPVETGFSILSSAVNKTIFLGMALDLSGLVVKATFSDGSNLILDPSLYSVDFSEFNGDLAGTYTIYVTYKETVKSFEVNVVEFLFLTVEDLLMKTTYLVGDSIDYTYLAVKVVLSDGSYIRLTPDDYAIDATAVNMAVPGTYVVTISVPVETLDAVTFQINVCPAEPSVVENKILLAIDDDYVGIQGALQAGSHHFSSLKAALAFVGDLGLASDVTKIFFIANGTYHEKIVVQIPNVVFVGENRDTTIITFDAASGLESPVGGNWGTQGSASVAIKSTAINFMATNITFANGFDYNGSTIGDKQGVALVTEADQVLFSQCKFLGWQDTLYAKSGRQYYVDCYIEGVVDFIFGNGGPAFFERCQIHSLARATGCLTAQKGYNVSASAILAYGYVFYDNDFTAAAGVLAGTVDLGRPWDQYAAVAYLANDFGSHITARGWTEMSGISPTNVNVRFYEYQNRFATEIYGNGIDDDGDLLVDAWWPTSANGEALTLESAALYQDKAVVFAPTNGAVDFGSVWDFAADLVTLQSLSYPA